MAYTYHYQWLWQFQASPTDLWPFIADTNRTTRDGGNPPTERVVTDQITNARIAMRAQTPIGPLEWDEEPFEWVRPHRFGVVRHFRRGPIMEMHVTAELTPRTGGGTDLRYKVDAQPKNLLGHLVVLFQIGWQIPRKLKPAIERYDTVARKREPKFKLPEQVFFASGGEARLKAASEALLATGAKPAWVTRLLEVIEQGDSFAVSRVRPYALADHWGAPRREILELCLQATRVGLLTLQWEVLCPLCRGAKQSTTSLNDLTAQVHCEACHIDLSANFDRSVELTFRPNAAIRMLGQGEFCMGGPQVTPHVFAQQLLKPSETRALKLPLEAGRYRVRTIEQRGGQLFTAAPTGTPTVTFSAQPTGWPDVEPTVSLHPELTFSNQTPQEQLFILERMEWSDQAATAAEVTTQQMFRDLFANEALRPGEKFSVGSITVLFTDLRGSTRLYRESGDAVAFGRVMSHFDVLREAIAQHDGALVKTIGDAVMAVFLRPLDAVQAVFDAQTQLLSERSGAPPLRLKAGIHTGPCVNVTLNDRLDYFGSTVNLAARLEGLSAQRDGMVISATVRNDPEVAEWLASGGAHAEQFEADVKGFEGEHFTFWAVRPNS